MKLIILFLHLLLASAIDIHNCHDEEINGMNLKICIGLKPYERVDFHDFTGENEIRLKDNKIYRNHGEFVAFYKDNTLYVAKEKYDLSRWIKLKNKLN